ncbi:MAG: transglutaminase-like domain-containing protein [Gemmataceae bacterium]
MPRWLLAALAALLACPCSRADEAHEVVLLDGRKIGTFHLVTTPDSGRLRTVATIDLALKRYGTSVRLYREESTVETPEGKVEGVGMRQGAPGSKQLVLTGTLDRDHMHVLVDGGRIDRHLPWPADVVGLRGQQAMFAAKKVQPGDRLTFRRYEPTYNRVLTVQAEVKGREAVDLLGERKTLLRVELTPDKIEGGGVTVRPPKAVVWLDDALTVARRQQEIDGLGTVAFVRTTREKALTQAAADVDVGARSLIALDRALSRPYDSRAIVYRVTARGEDEPASLLSRDEHQEVLNVRGSTFELHVHPPRPGDKGDARPEAAYLVSSHFLDHEDERVTELARRAVGAETDAWKKALRIERYVKNLMRNDNSAPLAPASAVARSPRGDCRHHAFLTAAMCRTAGLPSRTAIGLLYVYRAGPKFGFHMWTEVLIDGRWLGIDSTLGKGGVSAAHVKVTDHAWQDTASLTPLLPVSRVLGKLRFEVLKAE